MSTMLFKPQPLLYQAFRPYGTSLAASTITPSRQILSDYPLPSNPSHVLTIQRAEPSDLPLVQSFMRHHFSKHEPMTNALDLKYDDVEPIFYGPIIKQAVNDGYTVMAFDKEKLVGVSTVTLNKVDTTLPQPDLNKRDFGVEIDKLAKQLNIIHGSAAVFVLLTYLEDISVSMLPKVTKYLMRAEAGSIDVDYRSCDIRRKLGIESAKLALSDGYEYIDSMCTAGASTKVLGDLDFKRKFSLPYGDVLYHGKPLFKKPNLHDGNISFNLMQGNLAEISQLKAPKESTLRKFQKL